MPVCSRTSDGDKIRGPAFQNDSFYFSGAILPEDALLGAGDVETTISNEGDGPLLCEAAEEELLGDGTRVEWYIWAEGKMKKNAESAEKTKYHKSNKPPNKDMDGFALVYFSKLATVSSSFIR